MEVIVCGSRLVFKQDLEDLIHSLTAVAGISQAQICNEVEAINCESSSQRSNAQVLAEEAPLSSVTRLRNYRCYLPQKQGFEDPSPLVHSRSAILVHSKGGRLLENRDTTSFAGEDATSSSWLSFDHVRINIMAETLFYGSYSLQQWQRCLRLLHKYSKAATLSLGGHTISDLTSFNPSSTYNICFSADSSLLWSMPGRPGCNTSDDEPGVGMDLPPKLCDDNDWRGLVVSVVLQQSNDGRTPTTSSSSRAVKLACHLRSNDYCLNPMPTCFITADKFFDHEERRYARLTWVTYIPRALLTEFNVVSAVEARIYINCPGLTVHKCSISLLYQREVEKFQKFITDSWTSFFDKLPLIRQLVDADDDQNVHQRRPHIKDFDRDLMYNATLPSNKIPEWFGELRNLRGGERYFNFQLPPSPSLCSDQDWIGLALCATFSHDLKDNYTYICRLLPKKLQLFNYHQYKTTNEECHPDGHVIWLSYIPRRWFLHQLNDESVLSASFDERDQLPNKAGLRFVYEHNVEEFKQLCIDLHQLRD